MSPPSPKQPFPNQASPRYDEELISGYIDGTLSHRETQRARLLVEEDPGARRLYQELKAIRRATLGTRFTPPAEEAWPELPRTTPSRLSRRVGWLLMTSWLVVIVGLALWRFLSSTGDPLQIFLVLGLPGAFVLLLVSVLIDRLRDPDEERYRGVFR